MKTWLKRNLITLGRVCHAGVRNFFRNAWLTTAATAVMTVTLTIALSAVVINMALSDTIDDIAKDVAVSVYVYDGVEQPELDALRLALTGNEVVDSVNYISKEEALSIFQERNQDSPEILKGLSVTDNVLPASFEVNLKDLSRVDEIVALTEQEQFSDTVEETSVNEERRKSIDRIAGGQQFITRASVAAGVIFGVISTLIIFNTIRMAIFTRSYEIEIMKLIGATPGYIRGPYLFEASLYGVIAGILAFVTVYTGLLGLGTKVEQHIKVNDTIDFMNEYWYLVFGVMIGAGVLIGFISSGVAMAKYLRISKW